MTSKEIDKLEYYYNYLLSAEFAYPIYFDHKLADDFSTITHFYRGIVPNKNNKKNFGKNNNKLLIIPLFKNCEKYDDICPYPPYKVKSLSIRKKKFNSL